MLTHRGFSAWISCEGREMREFETVVDEKANKVSCWIACEVGKSFAIHWMDHGSNVDSAGYICLDGFVVPGRFLYGFGATQRNGIRADDKSERPFVFAKVEPARSVSGKLGSAPETTSNKDVGTIVLKIKQIKRTEPTHEPNAPQMPPPKPTRGRRSIDQACVSFGNRSPSSRQHPKTWSFVPYDKSNPGTFVQFVFRYRTRDFLLDQGIISPDDLIIQIPRGLSPQPKEEEEEEDTEGEQDRPATAPSLLRLQQSTPPSSPFSSGPGSSTLSSSSSTRLGSNSPAISAAPPLRCQTSFNFLPGPPSSQGSTSTTASPATGNYYRPHVSNYPSTPSGSTNPLKRRRTDN